MYHKLVNKIIHNSILLFDLIFPNDNSIRDYIRFNLIYYNPTWKKTLKNGIMKTSLNLCNISEITHDDLFEIDDIQIENVKKYCYLVSIIFKKTGLRENINYRIQSV